MNTIEPTDPLNEDDIIKAVFDNPEQETIDQVQQESITEHRPKYKYYSSFSVPKPGDVHPMDPCQRLPTELVSDEDIEKCLALCIDAKNTEGTTVSVSNALEEIIASFYQLAVNTHGSDYQNYFAKNVGKLAQYVVGKRDGVPFSIQPGHQKIDIGADSKVISGKAAVQYIGKKSKIGTPVKGILWASGLIISIEPLSEIEMINLHTALTKSNITMGRSTRGAALSGDNVHYNSTILEYLIPHIVNCNLKGFNKIALQKVILASDAPSLMAYALSAIYPSGYPTIHNCVNVEKGECNYNLEMAMKREPNGDYTADSLLDFSKVVFPLTTVFSEKNIAHLSASFQSHTLEEIRAYQEDIASRIPENSRRHIFTVKNVDLKIDILFKTPTIAEYAFAGNQWINSVNKLVETALSPDAISLTTGSKAERKANLLNKFVSVTDTVKHTGWIDQIIYVEEDGTERVVKDKQTISDLLISHINLDGFTQALETAVQLFKEDSLVSYTGFSNFECPVCGNGQTPQDSEHPTLIPINMTGFFFTIMEWRSQMRHGTTAL